MGKCEIATSRTHKDRFTLLENECAWRLGSWGTRREASWGRNTRKGEMGSNDDGERRGRERNGEQDTHARKCGDERPDAQETKGKGNDYDAQLPHRLDAAPQGLKRKGKACLCDGVRRPSPIHSSTIHRQSSITTANRPTSIISASLFNVHCAARCTRGGWR